MCILAGGVGSRLGEAVADKPKPLIEIAGKPFLLHQLELIQRHGFSCVVLCVGYLGEQIEQTIGTSRYGMEILYSYDGERLLGTLGAVAQALPLLGPRFLVMYGDSYLRFDYRAAADAWCASGLPAMMVVLRNEGLWDKSNAVYNDGLVVAHDKVTSSAEMKWIDYGFGGLTADALSASPPGATDLSELYRVLAERRLLFGYEAYERFYEIGRPESLAETERFLSVE